MKLTQTPLLKKKGLKHQLNTNCEVEYCARLLKEELGMSLNI